MKRKRKRYIITVQNFPTHFLCSFKELDVLILHKVHNIVTNIVVCNCMLNYIKMSNTFILEVHHYKICRKHAVPAFFSKV